MSKHTPGPWVLDYATRGYEVCTIHGMPPTEMGQAFVYVYPADYHWSEPENVAANAALIAAAPELFDACRALVEAFDAYVKEQIRIIEEPVEITAARIAIAKVEGRT